MIAPIRTQTSAPIRRKNGPAVSSARGFTSLSTVAPTGARKRRRARPCFAGIQRFVSHRGSHKRSRPKATCPAMRIVLIPTMEGRPGIMLSGDITISAGSSSTGPAERAPAISCTRPIETSCPFSVRSFSSSISLDNGLSECPVPSPLDRTASVIESLSEHRTRDAKRSLGAKGSGNVPVPTPCSA